ncbi:MAG TPA: ExeM/NucH family extracellular endonuclease [Gemmatimonadales bacterium]|nr:ExeM/NucH family extracellular endonuclease [Gemmatimonadales bacterium]
MSLARALLPVRRFVALALPVLLATACSNQTLPTASAYESRPLASLSASGVVISQVYGGGGNSGATYTHDFVELYNKGTTTQSVAGWSIQYASATGTGNLGASATQLVALSGSILPGKYLLIQLASTAAVGASLPTPDLTGSIAMSGTAGKVALVRQATGLGCNGGSAPCNAAQLALIEDLVGYGSANFFEGAATPTLSNTTAAIRKASGATDTDHNANDFDVGAPTPRNSATTGGGGGGGGGGSAGVCGDPITRTYAIQGSGASAAVTGAVFTEGVVVGDFEGASPALRGFFIQDATGDGDPATSDGLFIFNGANTNAVTLGDLVRVSGTAGENQGQTQISASAITVCSSGATMTPVDVMLPAASSTFLERYEGMLVRFPQTLTVTEHFQLGRFGQVVVSSGGRLSVPTNVVAPGAAAAALQAQNDLRALIVDDASQAQNPDPILFGRAANPLSASNTLRGGDQATGMVGVLTYTWAGNSASGNAYRLRPVNALGGGVPNFVAANPRPSTPAMVGGTMTVASANVLNYFNTFTGCSFGVGGAPADCRGANNATEFARQRDKIIASLATMNADVVGLMEIENDGYGANSAVADLVDGLNAVSGPGTWAFIDADANTGQVNSLGTDAIKVALLYQPARVTPTGVTATLNTTEFVNGGDSGPRNRPALAQAFMRPDGGRLVVSVNHLKSKGSACDVPDQGDGQGNCAAVRTTSANLLRAWLASDPTDTGEEDVLIIGDLNSYAMEDPITALTGNGYTNLLSTFIGAGAYSYAFDGQWGYLDHALASASLASQIAGVTEWHINADEPNVLDYNVEFKTAGLVASLYNADPYRSADHDPVLVGINLAPPPVDYDFGGFLSPVANAPAFNADSAGSTIPIRFSLGGNQGTNLFLTGFPASRPISCATSAVTGGFTSATGPGASKLTYARGADTYHYNWKTQASWVGTCRELVLRFRDGTQHRALFDFRP